MPDLFTHFVAARVPAGFLRDRRYQALMVLGTFLPDLVAKGLYWIMQARDGFGDPSHSILGIILLSYVVTLFLEEGLRRPGFWLLTAGGLIHVLVDLLKDNQGVGSARLFLPFSIRGVEFGWIDPENVVMLIPLDAAILAAALYVEGRRSRVQQ